MTAPITTHRKASSIGWGVFLISLGVLYYLNAWWPGILLALALSLGIKETLRGRIYDVVLTICIFVGLFLFFQFNPDWAITVPVLFTLGGIWLIYREVFLAKERSTEDIAEDISQEISEEEQDEK